MWETGAYRNYYFQNPADVNSCWWCLRQKGENNHCNVPTLCLPLGSTALPLRLKSFYSFSHLKEVQEWRKQGHHLSINGPNIKRPTSLFCSVKIKHQLDHHFSSNVFVSWIHHKDSSPANWKGSMECDAWLDYSSFCGLVQFGSFQSSYCYMCVCVYIYATEIYKGQLSLNVIIKVHV